jgi:hypothetical protein
LNPNPYEDGTTGEQLCSRADASSTRQWLGGSRLGTRGECDGSAKNEVRRRSAKNQRVQGSDLQGMHEAHDVG